MAKTLKEVYNERRDAEQALLAEGIFDYFKSGSENIQKFNATLAQLKNIANTYKLQSLQRALATAEGQFTDIVMKQALPGGKENGIPQKPDMTKSTMLSKVVTFVSTMAQFMDTFRTITSQLPAMKQAIDNAKNPDYNKPLEELLGADAPKFAQLIGNQLKKSSGGILNAIKGFLGMQNAATIMKEFGVDENALGNDILKLTPQQLAEFSQQSASTPSFQLKPETSQPGTKPAEKEVQAAGVTPDKQAEPTSGTVPSQAEQATATGSQKPDPNAAQQRDVAVQKVVRNRNAFNTQVLGGMSNQEIVADLRNIAKALGIKL